MRPNQQNNRRSRGRNNNQNNNRRSPNPLTRSYESNGPDVKIRGNAQTVADKYLTLARDAQSSGDRVMAENYFQHAEHYNRIIAMAQAQQAEQQAKREAEREAEQAAAAVATQEQAAIETSSDDTVLEGQDPEGAPQPEITETPAEVNMGSEKSATKKTERPRRTRRPRKTAEEKAAEEKSIDDNTPNAEPVAQDAIPAATAEKPSEPEEVVA